MFDYNRLSHSTLPSARAQGQREEKNWARIQLPDTSSPEALALPGWKSFSLVRLAASPVPSLLCLYISEQCLSLLLCFFFPLQNLSHRGFEWLTPSPLSTLGADLFRIVANRYFRSPWQPPVPYLQRIELLKGREETELLGENQYVPSSLFLCCHSQARGCFKEQTGWLGGKAVLEVRNGAESGAPGVTKPEGGDTT